MPLIKLTGSNDLSGVERLNAWETVSLVETSGLDPSLPGGADIVRKKE